MSMPYAKLLAKIQTPFSLGILKAEEAVLKGMRFVLLKGGREDLGYLVKLMLYVDQEDGIIADAKFQLFGPPLWIAIWEELSTLLLRKNYLQASRISAELLDQQIAKEWGPLKDRLGPQFAYTSCLNDALEVLDPLSAQCLDIPVEDVYLAPSFSGEEERTEYPGWETLSDEQKKGVVAEALERYVKPYVELDAGGVEVVRVEEQRVIISYKGNCTSCFSATGATLDAIGNILRRRIYPDLMVIPDLSSLNF